jgi:hypothetical protein
MASHSLDIKRNYRKPDQFVARKPKNGSRQKSCVKLDHFNILMSPGLLPFSRISLSFDHFLHQQRNRPHLGIDEKWDRVATR